MRVLVVDDEGVARRRLMRMLGKIEDVEIVGEADSGAQALERIRELRPDVALLDIRMPGMSGLELAARLPDPVPHIIFTTAHREHALEAFERSAVDYLLKPLQQERLADALDRVRKRERPADGQQIRELLEQWARGTQPPRLTARQGDSLHLIDPRQLSRFHSQGGYTAFRHSGRELLIDDTINALEQRLAAWGFVRVHRSELVNIDRIRAIRKDGDQTLVELTDGQQAVVSRRHLAALKQRLGIE